jgi:hypothetical protein
MPDSNHEGLPSAEDLDAVAQELQIQADTTVTKVNNSICASCGKPATEFCQRCGQDFCSEHRCIMHSEEFRTTNEPLVDDEGVTHEGRHIRLIGEGWPNSLRVIKDMTDEDLVRQVGGLQELLKDAIRTADYARISISAREYELDYRKHSRYVAAMKRREKIQQGSVRLGGKKHRMDASGAKVAIPADVQALMSLGLSYDQAVAMKSVLGATKKA